MTYSVDFRTLSRTDRYKMLCGLVIPRPIALVTTLGPTGVVNAAPFSFFNVISEEPPLLLISLDQHAGGREKDTALNIERDREFVVHLVDAAIVNQMHGCSEPVPADVSEVERVGFHVSPATRVAPPLIADAPAALECTLERIVQLPNRRLIIGEVVYAHAREDVVDPRTYRVNLAAYRPIGRLFADRYATMGEDLVLGDNAYVRAMKEAGRT